MLWDEYLRKVEPFTTLVPYMTVPGNHELAYNFSSFRHRFNNPGPGTNLYYSFDWGNFIHIIGIDTESELDIPLIDQQQLSWIEHDLKQVNQRPIKPWIIVMGHRPFYCSNDGIQCNEFSQELRLWVEDMFMKYNVDLVINAHVHDYERTAPVWRGTVFPAGKAPVYIVNGIAGNREGLQGWGKGPFPSWSLVRIQEFGYCELNFWNQTHLEWQMIADKDGSILDDMWLVKT